MREKMELVVQTCSPKIPVSKGILKPSHPTHPPKLYLLKPIDSSDQAPRLAKQEYVPLNEMQTRSGDNHVTDLSGLERKAGLLKLLLHVALSEEAQIAHLVRAAAVRLGSGQLTERLLPALDDTLMAPNYLEGLVFRARDLRLQAESVSLPCLRRRAQQRACRPPGPPGTGRN